MFSKSTIAAAMLVGSVAAFAPATAFAQAAGAATAGEAIKNYVKDQDKDLSKLDHDREVQQANAAKTAAKANTQPQTTTGSTTGGQSGFINPPAEEKPAGPNIVERCFNGICSFVKGIFAGEDEAKAQKEHNAKVDAIVEEKQKAEQEAKKVEPQKTAATPSTTKVEVKPTSVDLKSIKIDPTKIKIIDIKTVKVEPKPVVAPSVSHAVTVRPVVMAAAVRTPTIAPVIPRPVVPTVRIVVPTLRR